jgi:hypothetical protein
VDGLDEGQGLVDLVAGAAEDEAGTAFGAGDSACGGLKYLQSGQEIECLDFARVRVTICPFSGDIEGGSLRVSRGSQD